MRTASGSLGQPQHAQSGCVLSVFPTRKSTRVSRPVRVLLHAHARKLAEYGRTRLEFAPDPVSQPPNSRRATSSRRSLRGKLSAMSWMSRSIGNSRTRTLERNYTDSIRLLRRLSTSHSTVGTVLDSASLLSSKQTRSTLENSFRN